MHNDCPGDKVFVPFEWCPLEDGEMVEDKIDNRIKITKTSMASLLEGGDLSD